MDNTDLIGIPFKNKGRDKNGLDCYGLVKEVYHRYGIDIPEYDDQYKVYDDMYGISEIITENTKGYPWKEIAEPKAPCLVALRFGCPVGTVNHTGVYIGAGKFIHARERVGVCIDRISNPVWRRCIVGFYEFVGEK